MSRASRLVENKKCVADEWDEWGVSGIELRFDRLRHDCCCRYSLLAIAIGSCYSLVQLSRSRLDSTRLVAVCLLCSSARLGCLRRECGRVTRVDVDCGMGKANS